MILSDFFVITLHLTEFTLATHFLQAFSMFFVESFSLVNICEIIVVSYAYQIYELIHKGRPPLSKKKGQQMALVYY